MQLEDLDNIAIEEISDEELILLEELLEAEEFDLRKDGLNQYNDLTNPNYKFLRDSVLGQRFEVVKGKPKLVEGVAGCTLEGSSRSGKTWSGVDLIIWLCVHRHKDSGCRINIYRETFAEFKDTLYDDFKRRLDDFGLPNKFHNAENVKGFRIGKSYISFKGCDKVGKAHGAGADYVFFNEVMHIPYEIFKQATQRCRKFWWADYNPSFTDHWYFDKVLNRPDVGYLHTTYLDNPFASYNEVNEIEITEPYLPGSYEVRGQELFYKGEEVTDSHQPPPHPENVKNDTADEYHWKVYGLGIRGAMKGVIIKKIYWMDAWPDQMPYIWANDFGFTADPNALGKYHEDKDNIYVEVRCYEPYDDDDRLAERFNEEGVGKEDLIICDSSDRYVSEHKGTIEMVSKLRKNHGFKNCKKVRKTKSVMYWLGSMKKKKIHFVKNKYWKAIKVEKENYRFKEIQGIQINQPIDKYNHIWDLVRYGHIATNSDAKSLKTPKGPRKLGVNY